MAPPHLKGKTILLHNPSGLRVEIHLQDEGNIELWYSPRAERSVSHRDRNFSNRDDHMRLWDAIRLPGLGVADFLHCEYDPFYVTLHFTHQILRLAVSYHAPLIYLDTRASQIVDLKSHRNNQVLVSDPGRFQIRHQERRKRFEFTARSRQARFTYQPIIESGRSAHGSACLEPGQLLVIGGDLDEDLSRLDQSITDILSDGYDQTRDQDETAIGKALKAGTFSLRHLPELEKLVEVNRRILLAMQDKQGAIRAAIDRIYYLIWVRDGALSEIFQARSGNAVPLTHWKNFLLANATRIEDPAHKGWMYGQLTNPISKWQEDGLFFAVWTVYEHWTQTGTAPTQEELFTLAEATDWYERYCFDPVRHLFGRYFAGETAFKGTRDYGIDGMAGKYPDQGGVIFAGQQVIQSFDLYINLLNWNVYLMLAEMATDFKKIRDWKHRAAEIRTALLPLIDKEVPDYGWLILEDGRIVLAEAPGLSRSDYEWALTITPYFPTHHADGIRGHLLENILEDPSGQNVAAYYALLQAIDPLDMDQSQRQSAIMLAATPSVQPGETLPMPYTMLEKLAGKLGDPCHNVRPQASSIGPFLATLTGLGLRRLPHGLALRPNLTLKKIEHFEYRGRIIQVFFDENRSGLSINHAEIPHTWQVPENLLHPGKNVLHFPAAATAFPEAPTLLSSTARLTHIHFHGHSITYHFDAFGWNSFRLVIPPAYRLEVQEASGSNMAFKQETIGPCTWVHFDNSGDCLIRLLRD